MSELRTLSVSFRFLVQDTVRPNMRLTYALLATGIVLFADTDIVSAARETTENSPIDAPLVVHSPHFQREDDFGKRFLRNTVQTNDGAEDSEEKMFAPMINGLLGKVGSVVETGGPSAVKEAMKLEQYQQWLRAGLTPRRVQSQVSAALGVNKKSSQALGYILRSKDSDQYLKFMVDYRGRKPGSNIPKPASQMEKYELWLYAGLTPSQVQSAVNALSAKRTPLQGLGYVLRSRDSDQYLKFIVDFQLHQPGTKIPKPASQMQKYELWHYAGLTPSQVRVEVLKKDPSQPLRTILMRKDSEQYLKFAVNYKRNQPGSKISKPVSEMEKSELWLHAGLKCVCLSCRKRKGVLKKIRTSPSL